VTTQLDRIESSLASLHRKLTSWGTLIMATFQELQASADALEAKAAADLAQSTTAVQLLQALSATVADLRSQLPGTAVTQAQLDALAAQIGRITGTLTTSDAQLDAGIAAATPAP
jgi:hypothetical protein